MKLIKNLNKDIAEFGVYIIQNNKLLFCPNIKTKEDYTHGLYDLHHFIKDQDYQRNKDWYIKNGIKQKLILLPRQMHIHLENPIYALSKKQFFEKYKIKKEELLFNKKEWIDFQVRKELNYDEIRK